MKRTYRNKGDHRRAPPWPDKWDLNQSQLPLEPRQSVCKLSFAVGVDWQYWMGDGRDGHLLFSHLFS